MHAIIVLKQLNGSKPSSEPKREYDSFVRDSPDSVIAFLWRCFTLAKARG
jgi:hypothetical protein